MRKYVRSQHAGGAAWRAIRGLIRPVLARNESLLATDRDCLPKNVETREVPSLLLGLAVHWRRDPLTGPCRLLCPPYRSGLEQSSDGTC